VIRSIRLFGPRNGVRACARGAGLRDMAARAWRLALPTSPFPVRGLRSVSQRKSEAKDFQRDESECPKSPPPPPPTNSQLRIHALNCAIPMIGFGFMDNLVMIQMGDFIDNSIGVHFGLTTLTAAALGQVCSDVSGVCFGGAIEQVAAGLGLPHSKLTPEQLSQFNMRLFSTIFAALGVIVGCLFGMVVLLFKDLDRAERQKKAKRLGGIFDTLVRDGRRILSAQRCNLWLVTEEGDHLWSRAFTGDIPNTERLREAFHRFDQDSTSTITEDNLMAAFDKLGWEIDERFMLETFKNIRQAAPKNDQINKRVGFGEFKQLIKCILKEDRRIPIRNGGAKHRVLTTGKIVNIQNSYAETQKDQFSANYDLDEGSTRKFDRYTGYDTFSVLLVPVVVEDPKRVIGLIEFANKTVDDVGFQAFNEEDEKIALLLASVTASFISDTIKSQD